MTARKRQTHYPAQITVRVPLAMKAGIEAMADRLEQDTADVVRAVIEIGLPLLDASEDTPDPEDVNLWWEGLPPRMRSRWGKRLRHIEGQAAFRAEAYRRSMAAAS